MEIPTLYWALEKESFVCKEYKQMMKKTQISHVKFKIKQAGLFVNPLYPHLGALLDGLVSCTCCGKGVINVHTAYKTVILQLQLTQPTSN